MSKSPLVFIRKKIKALHSVAYHGKGIRTVDGMAEFIFGHIKDDYHWSLDALLKFNILEFIQSKWDMGDLGHEQKSLFSDYDETYFSIKVDGLPSQITLGDVDEETMPAILAARESNIRAAATALDELTKAWRYVQPLLASHPGWKWRDAVHWMEAHGGVPDLGNVRPIHSRKSRP